MIFGGVNLGRPRKLLVAQEGNLNVETQLNKAEAENLVSVGKSQLDTPPDWLINQVATDEFKRVVKEFNKIDVIGNLDLNNIAGYCNSFALYVEATNQLKYEKLAVERETPNGGVATTENPLIKIQKNYATEMRSFAALCGLTIDSRLKIGSKKAEETQQEIEDTFGNI